MLLSDQQVTRGSPKLSHASAASALAHANQKPVEIWRPGRYVEAEKAALCMKDFTPPEIPLPSTGYSAEGLGAAILAVREQRSIQASQKHDIEIQQSLAQEKARQEKALRAAAGAYATRKRADSAPSEPVIRSEPRFARTAAGACQQVPVEEETPPDEMDKAMEASRVSHRTNTNAKLYAASLPITSAAEERSRQNSLRAAALSMAKDMYETTRSKGDPDTDVDPAIHAAQRGHDQAESRKSVSGAGDAAGRNAWTLQEAAQKRAAEKLARLRNEHAEMQAYYGTAPRRQRSLLTTRRRRASTDTDASQMDAEQSRHIRHQMTSLRSQLDRVDEQRQQDRDLLMEAARRNVDQAMQDLDMRMWADIGRAPPSVQKQWDEAAEARARRETESVEMSGADVNANRVDIGGRRYIDMADVEAVARSRIQPTLDEITDQAEHQRANELEEQLDAKERERRAAIAREREAEMRALTKQKRGQYSRREVLSGIWTNRRADASKRESKGPSFFQLLRRKSKRVPEEKPETVPETETPKEEDDLPPVEPPGAQGAAAATGAATETSSTSEAATAAEGEREPVAEAAPADTAPAVEAPTTGVAPAEPEAARPSGEQATASEPLEEPEAAGASTILAAASATDQRDTTAVGGMHTVRPITSPKADSKLKNWFRDRLVRRSSGPIPVYPNQPGPDANTDSQIGFSGGAALRESNEPRGAALSSHPVSKDDIEEGSTNGNGAEVSRMSTYDSTSSEQEQSANGKSKRQRLRNSFMKTVGRSNQGPKMNGTKGSPKKTEASGSKETDTGVQGLRNSAVEQGLPVPPVLGESTSTGRGSRFSEDL